MTYMLILAGIVLVPLFLISFFRSNSMVVFMSLCLGSVLATYATPDIAFFLTEIFGLDQLTVSQWSKLIVLVTPPALAIIFTMRSVSGSRRFINVLPALATGPLFALLAVPLLPADLQKNLMHASLWHTLDNLQTAILLGGAFFSLMFLFITSHRPAKSDEKHK